MLKKHLPLLLLPLAIACSAPGGGYNPFFTIEDDKLLGQQLEGQIASDPQNYPILDKAQYPQAYAYLEAMRDEILASGEVHHAQNFEWKLYIIHDDNTLNAFAAPGGYMYIYTGLFKYLPDASSLAGVVGHEMAHADERHSVNQMSKMVGFEVLCQIATGTDAEDLVAITAQLSSLKFSRSDEKEADSRSVHYLCKTSFQEDGAANFFEMMLQDGGEQPPEFLSTHPSHENRVADINKLADEMTGCSPKKTPQQDVDGYKAFLASLPK